MEDVFLHNKLFYLVVKKIDGSSSCAAVVERVISEIVTKLSEKKYNVETSEADKKELTNSAFEILFYLESQKVIILTDTLRLNNHYKIAFDIFQKSESQLYQEFLEFIETINPASKNQSKLALKQLLKHPGFVRQFFVFLNGGLNVNSAIIEMTKTEGNQLEKPGIRTVIFFLWLFGHIKGYLKRLFEVPIPYPIPTAPIQAGTQYDEASLQSMKRRHQNSAFDYLQFEACRECLLMLEYSKDEIMQRLDISEPTYYDLLRDWNINSHLFIEF